MSLRLGIIGTGTIAHKMARTVPLVPAVTLAAVASRSQSTASAFAEEFSIPTAYPSYDALYAAPDIDAVYVATPHPLHYPCALAAIRSGKHVLCEKPLTLTRADSAALYAAAREHGVFLMEAMWTRFIPTVLTAKRWLDDGRIGKVRYMTAAFGYHTPYDPTENIFRADMKGGALYDVGVYCIEAALDFMKPQTLVSVTGTADMTPSGVDAVNAFTMRFDGGAVAGLSSAISCTTDNAAVIYGERGRIKLGENFYAPRRAELIIGGKVVENHEIAFTSGFEYELAHFERCIKEKKPASDRIPPEDTLKCAEVFEKLTADWGYQDVRL